MIIVNQKDFASGLLYIALGSVVTFGATSYPIGTAASMGPGFFPFWLGLILALVGGAVIFHSLGSGRSDETGLLEAWHVRSLLIITISVVAFGVALSFLGLIAAIVVLTLISSTASQQFTLTRAAINTVLLLFITIAVFVYGLGLQIQIWPPFMLN
ncbi:membrane protein [Agaricicola taiwanensis]|uniref:Membrane protein n=1 Tax=Agaricicola taiwanensis TaxID=591372 RepID=A0A8J2YIL3_9RHOB|nr:tripartite tricarboxylate transporter TctB family protein [Agaricicola taiwanensis]GGE45581.1 membrane protein [Agaricicola taiwanensis]